MGFFFFLLNPGSIYFKDPSCSFISFCSFLLLSRFYNIEATSRLKLRGVFGWDFNLPGSKCIQDTELEAVPSPARWLCPRRGLFPT